MSLIVPEGRFGFTDMRHVSTYSELIFKYMYVSSLPVGMLEQDPLYIPFMHLNDLYLNSLKIIMLNAK